MESTHNEIGNAKVLPQPRKPWKPMTLTYLGKISEVVQMGGGKLTATTGDSGEPRKVPSTG